MLDSRTTRSIARALDGAHEQAVALVTVRYEPGYPVESGEVPARTKVVCLVARDLGPSVDYAVRSVWVTQDAEAVWSDKDKHVVLLSGTYVGSDLGRGWRVLTVRVEEEDGFEPPQSAARYLESFCDRCGEEFEPHDEVCHRRCGG